MSTQSSQSVPSHALKYDNSGNPYVLNEHGRWQPMVFINPIGPNAATQSYPPIGQSAAYMPASTGSLSSPNDDPFQLTTPADFATQREPTMGSATSRAQTSIVVASPQIVPLDNESDSDQAEASHALNKTSRQTAVAKVAGSRRKGKQSAANKEKGKGKEVRKRACAANKEDDVDDEIQPKAKRGRPQGSNNFTSDEVTELLNILEVEQPLGPNGWSAVHKRHSKWAHVNGCAERTLDSLQTKFKQLTKMKKPTGDGVRPPEVTRALYIDGLINDHVGTRDLDDGDYVDRESSPGVPIPWSDSDNELPCTAIVRSNRHGTEAPASHRTARGAGLELFSKLTEALDPRAQRAREEEQASRSLQNTHILTLTQQLRDAQRTTDKLQDQIFMLRNQLYEADRARSKAELHIEFMQMAEGVKPRTRLHLPKRQRLQQEWYPEGGGSLTWITDEGESDDPVTSTPPRAMELQSPAIHREMKLRRRHLDDGEVGSTRVDSTHQLI